MAKAPNLSCLRMSVLSAAAAWTWWPLRWAKLDMSSQSHTAWALGPSEPPTSVSDGGLWGGAPVDRTLTPAAQDSGNSSLPPSQATRDTLPGDLIRYSATPVGAGGGSTSRGGDRKGELLLGGQIRQQSADGPCPSSPDTSSTNGNSPGSISAAWETQYMGYPDGWLALGTEQESWLSATLSSRRSSRRSRQA